MARTLPTFNDTWHRAGVERNIDGVFPSPILVPPNGPGEAPRAPRYAGLLPYSPAWTPLLTTVASRMPGGSEVLDANGVR